jgi:16S rRNA (adenine1518-N6/adenine1519-N6)-dimethyltransferase
MSIETLPPLREIIAEHSLRAEKKLGQNFLLDLNLTAKIAKHAGDLIDATVFEIGPGPGGLTRALLQTKAAKVIAIEYDTRAIAALGSLVEASDGRLTVLHQDALEINLLTLAPSGKRAIIANLPYNIATPLLIGWLKQIRNDQTAFASMTLMFQREVAERIVAVSDTKAYGRLAVMAQWLCGVKKLFDLPPSAFTPPPKVTSSVVQFIPKPLTPDAPPFAVMEEIVAAAFNQRRKMLRSSLRDYSVAMKAVGIDDSLRAEDVPVADYVRLVSALYKSR